VIGSQHGFLSASLASHLKVLTAVMLLQLNLAQAAEPPGPGGPVGTVSGQQTTVAGAPLQTPKDIPFDILQKPSLNPFDAYRGRSVAPPSLGNSSRLDSLIRDGKLYLHLQDAIDLALENNLDLVIARYNLPIARMDILRTSAGGTPRGVNTGVVSGTPGGANGAFAGTSGAGAGGTSGGAGGAGAGASGLVQSTLGTGTMVNFYDPLITAKTYVDHTTQLLPNQVLYGVPVIHQNTFLGNISYQQAFPTGGTVQVAWNNNRQTTNSPNNSLNPVLNSYFEFYANQQLLSGFGRGPNLSYLRIAKTNQKVSDVAFRAQLIATVTQICDLYWDLVNAYDNEQVGERSVAFATTTLDTSRKQFELQAIPEMDVLKAEADVATREQDLTIARTNLELQELYMKNAITRSLDDPVLQDMPVIPLDHTGTQVAPGNDSVQELMTYALKNRTEVLESSLVLENSALSRKTARNALLPQLSLYGLYAGTGYAGIANPLRSPSVDLPRGFGGAVSNAFNYSSPEYQVGLQLQVPLRNRIAKADQYRTELEYRQSQVYLEELKKRIRIEVRNARFALEQGVGRVSAARKARDLAQRTLNIMQQEQKLGAGSNQQTLAAEHDLALAESALVSAETDYEKARVEMRRAAGSVLEDYGISVAAAKSGIVEEDHSR
jgi:outer membrane protein TolC